MKMLTRMLTNLCPTMPKTKKPINIPVQLVDSTMPKAGFEPARLAAPPPQDGVSASSTTSARLILPLTSFPACWALPEPEQSAAVVAAAPEAAEPVAAVVVAVAVAAVVSRLPG